VQETAAATSRARYEQLQNRHEIYVREQLDNRDRLNLEHNRLSQVCVVPALAAGCHTSCVRWGSRFAFTALPLPSFCPSLPFVRTLPFFPCCPWGLRDECRYLGVSTPRCVPLSRSPHQDLENQYELKLAIEMERYDALSDVLERERQTFKASVASANARRESEVAALTQEIHAKQRAIDDLRVQKEVLLYLSGV
jgi:hypothetical protein